MEVQEGIWRWKRQARGSGGKQGDAGCKQWVCGVHEADLEVLEGICMCRREE